MVNEARSSFLPLIVMGVLQGLSIAAKNEALMLLRVTSRTMIFNLSVLVTMFLARLFRLESLGPAKLVAATCLTVGGVLQQLRPLGSNSNDGAAATWPPQ